jgi:hypothetical protein
MHRVTKPALSAPVRRGGQTNRWCASNAILVMLAVLLAVGGGIEFLRG